MSKKRFTYNNPIGFGKGEIIDNQNNIHYEATISVLLQLLNGFDDVLNEQQATIEQLEKNFDDLVQYAGKIAKRNVQLDEEIAKLKKELQKQ